MDCFVASAPRNDGGGSGRCDKLARRAKLLFTRKKVRFIRMPSRPGQRGVRTSRTWGGNAVDAEVRWTSAADAYGKSVWSRRRGAGVNASGGRSISQGATEAKEPFSGESTL